MNRPLRYGSVCSGIETDYGVFKASAEDIRLGDDMSHEQAVKTAKRSASNQKGARWYDFGDTEYNEE
jgi:hypothetical protein